MAVVRRRAASQVAERERERESQVGGIRRNLGLPTLHIHEAVSKAVKITASAGKSPGRGIEAERVPCVCGNPKTIDHRQAHEVVTQESMSFHDDTAAAHVLIHVYRYR